MEKESRESTKTITITLGDLIEAMTEYALEESANEREGYELAKIAVERLLNQRPAQETY